MVEFTEELVKSLMESCSPDTLATSLAALLNTIVKVNQEREWTDAEWMTEIFRHKRSQSEIRERVTANQEMCGHWLSVPLSGGPDSDRECSLCGLVVQSEKTLNQDAQVFVSDPNVFAEIKDAVDSVIRCRGSGSTVRAPDLPWGQGDLKFRCPLCWAVFSGKDLIVYGGKYQYREHVPVSRPAT